MRMSFKLKNQIIGILNPVADWLMLLPIRLLLAYEFGAAGMMKFNIGGYKAENIEFVVGFDIDERKIGLPLGIILWIYTYIKINSSLGGLDP